MSEFHNQVASTAMATLDPNKHVKYSLGMVLGADDLEQEFAYVSNLPQWLARETIGYGTVCGLKVSIESDEQGLRVAVEPGVALTPRGQLVRVTPAQCAYINDWLDLHRDEVTRQVGSPLNSQLTLYVILCYRACPTDMIPIPGEPCRDETDSTVDSRWQDDFELKLSLKPPEQLEEDSVRLFVEWLSQIEISEEPTSFADIKEFLDTLRNAAPLMEPTPGSPLDFPAASPLDSMHINSADACEYMRAAFLLWVTELRPRWRGYDHYTVRAGDSLATIAAQFNTTDLTLAAINHVDDSTLAAGMVLSIPTMYCDGMPPEEDCLLLAELGVPLLDGRADAMTNDNIHEERRPYLIHLRLLQEWLLCGARAGGSRLEPADDVISEITFGQLPNIGSRIDRYALVDHTHGTPPLPVIPVPPAPGTIVVEERKFGLLADAGNGLEYSRANHTHGTPPLQGDVEVLDPAADPEFVKVVGILGDPIVAPVDGSGNELLQDGDVLTFRANQWVPEQPSATVTGTFVEHPVASMQYSIVAAGIVMASTSGRSPVYNNLKVVNIPDAGEIVLHFDGYIPPKTNDVFQYIVKALPVFNAEIREPTQGVFIINFLRFDDEGFSLWVTDLQGNPIDKDLLSNIEMMVEVSRYGDRMEESFMRTMVASRPLVNINTATMDELRSLPRIGPELASRIISARAATDAGFRSVDDLLNVRGIGEDLLQVLAPFITITSE